MNSIRIAVISAFFGLAGPVIAGGAQPAQGECAPGFRLQDQNYQWHDLEDYRGQWVLLFFYPKADTPGCTKEACAFRDDIFKFKKLGAKVLGVSVDDVRSQKEFADKYHLPFPLLSDANKEMAEAYGVLRNLGVMKIARRESFIIAPDGSVAKHYGKVDPAGHSAEVLSDLETLMGTPP